MGNVPEFRFSRIRLISMFSKYNNKIYIQARHISNISPMCMFPIYFCRLIYLYRNRLQLKNAQAMKKAQTRGCQLHCPYCLKLHVNVPIHFHQYPALVQIMAWRRPGDKPLSEPMMLSLLTHICVTRPHFPLVPHVCVSESDQH